MLDFIYKVNLVRDTARNLMKLKLETASPPVEVVPAGLEITLLVVTEGIEANSMAVLKAGLNKLIASGRRRILLDCSSLQESDFQDSSLISQVSGLREWALSLEGQAGAQVIVISAAEKLGHVRSREEGITLLTSGTAPLLELEAKLQSDIKVLQSRKAEIEAKLQRASASGDPKALRKQNSALKRSIADAERLTRRFLKNRANDPFQVPATELLQQALNQMLDTVLKKEGILL